MQRTTTRPRVSAVAQTAVLAATVAGCTSEQPDSGAGSVSGEGITV